MQLVVGPCSRDWPWGKTWLDEGLL